MKFISSLSAILLLVIFTASAQDEEAEAPVDPALAVFKWDQTVLDLGKVVKGDKVNVSFTYTNAGTEPIFVYTAKAHCTCVWPEYTNEMVAPGAKGIIKATFAASSTGPFDRHILVLTSVTYQEVTLHLTGEVLEK